jgi:hypothetical protein
MEEAGTQTVDEAPWVESDGRSNGSTDCLGTREGFQEGGRDAEIREGPDAMHHWMISENEAKAKPPSSQDTS